MKFLEKKIDVEDCTDKQLLLSARNQLFSHFKQSRKISCYLDAFRLIPIITLVTNALPLTSPIVTHFSHNE